MFTIADVSTVGLYVGWVFGIIGTIALILGVYFLLHSLRTDNDSYYGKEYDRETLLWLGVGTAGTGVVVLLITLLSMWPLKYEYHHYVSKSGTVEKISNRFISNGDNGTSQRFVVKMVGDPAAYSIDDTRASLLTVGAEIGIKCKKEHQFFQPYEQNGWACRWGA